MKTKPFMYLIGYNSQFKTNCNTGWGCGYVAIPLNHRLVKKHYKRISDEENEETDEYSYVSKYFELSGLEQDITYTEKQLINGIEYLTIGFDTAHIYNNESHDFDYVFTETNKILKLINNY